MKGARNWTRQPLVDTVTCISGRSRLSVVGTVDLQPSHLDLLGDVVVVVSLSVFCVWTWKSPYGSWNEGLDGSDFWVTQNVLNGPQNMKMVPIFASCFVLYPIFLSNIVWYILWFSSVLIRLSIPSVPSVSLFLWENPYFTTVFPINLYVPPSLASPVGLVYVIRFWQFCLSSNHLSYLGWYYYIYIR